MLTRREVLGCMAWPVVAGAAVADPRRFEEAVEAAGMLDAPGGTAAEVARDEDFWFRVSQAFTVDRTIVNLNNGGVSPSPAVVQEAVKRNLDFSNEAPTYTMWRILRPRKDVIRARLAREFADGDGETIAITRNASESLQTCQLGLPLVRGDEVLTTDQDYPRMITTFRQRERREGIVLKQISIPVPCTDDDEIVRRFADAITPRTRLILCCHMVNLTGQILPVKAIVAMARARGIPVVVDGAHALAHFDFRITDLDCDFYAASLHKWLFAPHGTGLLYVRRDKIADVWPLMAATEGQDADIRKFEEVGTRPLAIPLGIDDALTFHQGIGGARKEARLIYLRDTWANRLLQHDRIRLHTSLEPGYACGIATVEIEGIETKDVVSWLFKAHKILTTGITHPQFTGARISPSVYTTLPELDRFCEAMEHLASHGLDSS